DFSPDSADRLIDDRFVLEDFTAAGAKNEIPLRVQTDVICPIKCQRDGLWIAAAFYPEVIFKPRLVSVIDKINARVDAFIADLGIGWNVRHRMGAPKVMHLPGLLLLAADLRIGFCTGQARRNKQTPPVVVHREPVSVTRERDAVALTAREESGIVCGLSTILLERKVE